MRRREFITLLVGAAAWPLAVRAQQPMPVVGILRATSPEETTDFLEYFSAGLNSQGFVDTQNVTVELHRTGSDYSHLPALVSDLVQRQIAIVVPTGAVNVSLAAKAATTTIPIVFVIGSDPVERGLVTSL